MLDIFLLIIQFPFSQAEDSQEEREMQTDDDCVEVKIDYDKSTHIAETEFKDLNQNQETADEKGNDTALEASKMPFPDAETSFSDFQDESEPKPFEGVVGNIVKRRRRMKRKLVDNDGVIISDMPPELAGDPKMRKYWRKRHSLFHR